VLFIFSRQARPDGGKKRIFEEICGNSKFVTDFSQREKFRSEPVKPSQTKNVKAVS